VLLLRDANSDNDQMLRAPQGLHAFFRAYYFYKSADYRGNNPHPVKGMAAIVAPFMPRMDYTANCKWLTKLLGCVGDGIWSDWFHRRAAGPGV